MLEDLTDKWALVTGGSRGIGQAIAKRLHQAGAHVVISGRQQDTLKAAAAAVGARCHAVVCDHSDPEAIRKLADTILKDYQTPDILVNNAGLMKSTPVAAMPLELWNQVLATNLTGVFLTTQAFLPGMVRKNRGDIFMISSMSGKKGDPGAAAYAASKFGLQGFSQALNYEVRKHNIRVMVLNPSRVDTSDKEAPLYGEGQTLHKEEIAELIAHLASLPGRTLVRDLDIWGTNP